MSAGAIAVSPGVISPADAAVVRDALQWLGEVAPRVFSERRDLQLDSRRIGRGDVFLALRGAASNGRDFLPEAAARGAAAALVEADALDEGVSTAYERGIPVRAIRDLRGVLGALAAEFYGRPSRQLLSIGVTGTNGKTSSTQWIAQLLTRAGRRCAVIGTIGIGLADEPLAASALTTPDAVSLQRELRALLDAGAQALAMEVSSIGLVQRRLDGMKFDVALYTNLTRDHLDHHGTMQQYEAAKALLFDWPTLSHAVINLDDAAGRRLLPQLARRGIEVIGYSVAARDDPAGLPVAHLIGARSIRWTARGVAFEAVLDTVAVPIEVALVGRFNVENLLGVLGVLHACGIEFSAAVAALAQLKPPAGRMQHVSAPNTPLAVVDYAHTPDALTQALTALRPLAEARGGKLWIVFGAGGDRDPGKRPLMGAAAAAAADWVVVTSDNPRSENPAAIIEQVACGIPVSDAMNAIVDRHDAIAFAIAQAGAADVVLIAGKGHEDYQIIGAEKRPFSDVSHARAAIERRAQSHG